MMVVSTVENINNIIKHQNTKKNSSNDVNINNQENANLIFKTNSTEQMRITSGGNIGIGINPSSKFHIHSTTTPFSFQMTNTNTSSTSTDGFKILSGL